MADGTTKQVEDIDVSDEMEAGGEVIMVMRGDGQSEKWFDVDGIHVTSMHLIQQDDRWTYVKDSGARRLVGKHDFYYVVVNAEHRMVAANGQVFGDYADTGYDVYGTGWDDFLLATLNGETGHKFVEWEKRRIG